MDKELLKPVSDQVCILYNQHGDIVHTHRVVSLRGGRVVTDEEVETHARARARAAGHDITTLSALRVAGEEYHSSSIYHVDVVNRKLVKTG